MSHPSDFYPGSAAAQAEDEYQRAVSLYDDGEITRAEAASAGVTAVELDRIDARHAQERAADNERLAEVQEQLDAIRALGITINYNGSDVEPTKQHGFIRATLNSAGGVVIPASTLVEVLTGSSI